MATAPKLYDATGTEVPLIGPPPAAKVIPPGVTQDVYDRFRMYPSRDLNPNTLVGILEESDAGDPYRLIELCEEMVEKDGKLESILKSRTAGVVGLNWDVVPIKRRDESDEPLAAEIAAWCQEALAATEFSELLTDLMDAVGKPFAVDWITWGSDLDGKLVPVRFSRIPTKHLRWGFQTDEVRVFTPMQPGQVDSGGEWGTPLPAYSTVRAIDLSRRDHPTRAGVLRGLVWAYWFKTTIIKDMVSYGDRYGLPPRTLKIDQADFDNAERYNKFRQAMRDFGSDLSAVISKSADLEMQSVASRDGVDVFMGQIDYFDKWMAWKVLGHELTSQSSPGQGQLGITAAIDVRQDIKEADCRWLAGIIKRDLLTPMVGWNFGWDAVARRLVPEFQFDYELPRDLKGESEVLDRVMRLFPGLTVDEQKIRDDYGIPEPGEGEAGLVAAKPQPAVPFGAVPGDPGADPEGDGQAPPPPDDEEDGPATGPRDEPPGYSRTAAAGRRTHPAPPQQRQVDALAARGIKAGAKVSAAWAAKLRQVLRQAADDGLTLAQARQRIVEAYPDLPADDLDQNIREQLLLVRLFGRNG